MIQRVVERVIGIHAGCGGEVIYFSTASAGYRTCSKCGADGQYGRPSPDLESKPQKER